MAPGIAISWDPTAPHRCAGFRAEAPEDLRPVVDVLRALGAEPARWLRLVALLAFDRLLHLPLNRSLLDAEIAVAQHEVARTLAPGSGTREHLVRQALGRARDAAPGLLRYLEHLVVRGSRPPRALDAALERVAAGYRSLLGEVGEPDPQLAVVTEAWHQLSQLDVGDDRGADPVPRSAPSARGGVDLLDPRMVKARLLDLGTAVDAAEIDVTPMHWKGRPAVRVRVAAYGGPGGPDDPDLAVRLVERRSGEICGHGLLGERSTVPSLSLREADDAYFEGVVELPDGVDPDDVRVDLVDAGAARPLPPAIDDAELRRVRRAALFLAAWRSLVAEARLWGVGAAPADRLRDLADRLGPGPADAPLWAGGPSTASLHRLADLGDEALAELLAADGPPTGVRRTPAAVHGPGDLLAAEVAAAFERRAA
ncbi:hypothetical protein [Pseudonocardia lacus]|uniref:hypothetical protein n=1 Tax=Pseudonocardia lacus TaxID=2835865 RepID=UPI001BDC97F4|nr:hypothetical protein [Pseudonocardia lacus]